MLDAQFKLLIQNAHKLENEFIELLSNEGDNVIIPTRNSPFSDYDFIINDVKYEIKLDKRGSSVWHNGQVLSHECFLGQLHEASNALKNPLH